MTETKDYYTLKEAEGLLQVTRRTLYNYLKNGKLDGAKKTPGGCWRIPRAAIEQFIDTK